MNIIVKGISQEELANKIGVSRQTISKWDARVFSLVGTAFGFIGVVLMPYSCCFNLLQGWFGGFIGYVSSLPELGNSYSLYAMAWFVYIFMCAVFDVAFFYAKKRK